MRGPDCCWVSTQSSPDDQDVSIMRKSETHLLQGKKEIERKRERLITFSDTFIYKMRQQEVFYPATKITNSSPTECAALH